MAPTTYHQMRKAFEEFREKAGPAFTIQESNGLFSLYFNDRRVIAPCPADQMLTALRIRLNILDQGEL